MLIVNDDERLRHYMFSHEMALNDHASQLIDKERKGEEKKARAIVLNMLDQGIEIATIAQLTGISLEKVKTIVASVTN